MLILSRKEGEGIYIGNNIEVNVVAVSGKRVKLSFDAPRDVSIMRTELLATEMEMEMACVQNQVYIPTLSKIPR